ncbi:MAG TPA: TolC family protein, partial [Cellvibrionaceae bacterium]
ASDLPASIQDVLYAAYQGNPGFHAAIKNIAAAEGSVKRERAGYLPRVELRARHGTQHNLGVYDDRVDPADFGDDTTIELALTYNLFNGGANRSAVRRSLAEVNQAKSERDQACINLRQQVQIVHNSSERIEEQLVSLRRHRDSINNVRAAYAEQFQIGQRTLLDVLDAENEYFQASRALINAEHDLTIAHAALLSLTGELLPALNLTRSQLSFLGDDEAGLGNIQVEPSAVCPALAPATQTRGQLISDVITLEIDTLFVGQSTALSGDAMLKLATLQQQWQRSGALAAVDIIAYNATSSSLKINQSLADARAQAVKQYLLINGLQAARVDARGQGIDVEQAAVIAPNASRIEITLHTVSS